MLLLSYFWGFFCLLSMIALMNLVRSSVPLEYYPFLTDAPAVSEWVGTVEETLHPLVWSSIHPAVGVPRDVSRPLGGCMGSMLVRC